MMVRIIALLVALLYSGLCVGLGVWIGRHGGLWWLPGGVVCLSAVGFLRQGLATAFRRV